MKQWSLFAGLVGALVFSLSYVTRASYAQSLSQSSEAVTDCDELHDRMESNDRDIDQNATCSATVTAADGRVVTKTFYARTALQDDKKTVSLVIDELCEACKTTSKRHVRPLDSINDIRNWVVAQTKAEFNPLDRSGGVDGCAVNADGSPGKSNPDEILDCRVAKITGQNPAAELAYYRAFIGPELRRLLQSTKPADRTKVAGKLSVLHPKLANNPVALASVKMMGNYVYYAQQIAWIEAQVADPTARATAVGTQKKLWSELYKNYRMGLLPAVADGAILIETANELERNLNTQVAKYGVVTPGGTSTASQGRTTFGDVRGAPGRPLNPTLPVGPGVGRPVGQTPGVATGSFDQRILRPRG